MPALVREPVPAQVGWTLSLYLEAREAGGCFVSSRPRPRPRARGEAGANPERARAEGDRRARTSARRYCAANGLNRMAGLTYAGEGCHDPRQLRTDVGEFFRRLRTALGGKPLPYLWVGEWHPKGHGLHVHFGVGRYVKRSLIEEAWGRGFVHIKLLGQVRSGAGVLEEARHVAGYLSKYVTKAGSPGSGLHRYEVAQGFQPRRVVLRGRSEADVLDQACHRMGAAPIFLWRSNEVEDWEGPPALSARWAA